ncbi:MAG: hypothetical protein Q8S51_08345, partial [Rhodoferax sp.]|nr:hypothetical protein [Rhodoferax sp.]
MAFDKDAFLTALDSMTVMELNDLVKAIEEKFGVSAAAMSAPAAGGGAAAAVAEEKTEFNVVLLDAVHVQDFSGHGACADHQLVVGFREVGNHLGGSDSVCGKAIDQRTGHLVGQ